MYGIQLYMDTWRMLQGLEDVNGIEKLIYQGISHKLKKEGDYGTQGYEKKMNGIELIKRDVSWEQMTLACVRASERLELCFVLLKFLSHSSGSEKYTPER